MNEAVANPPAAPPFRGESFGRRKFYLWIMLALLAHVAFVFIFGTKKTIIPRAVADVPQLQIADSSSEFVALDDPTLFTLPHANDFAAAVWLRSPVVPPPSFTYTEPPQFLPLPVEKFGASFSAFMQTNRFAEYQFDFKPQPLLSGADMGFASVLPQHSTLRVAGELASRLVLNQVKVPSLPYNDVIRPSRVQVLVDASGNVVSTMLLESSEYDAADQTALTLARAVRFAPADHLAFGELVFNWHTMPANAP